MYGVVLAFHLLVCLALIGVILIQSGKGGGLAGGAFGGATQTVFGGRGATDFITKATIYLGVIFFVTSLGLAVLTAKGGPGGRPGPGSPGAGKGGPGASNTGGGKGGGK